MEVPGKIKQVAVGEILAPDSFHHVCAVVRNIEKTMSHYSGTGPPRIREIDLVKVTVRGKPGAFKFKLSFANLGPIRLEFIQPVGESIYQEFLDERGEGLHHLCFIVNDLETKVEEFLKLGASVLTRNESFAYLDAGDFGGLILELVDSSFSPTLSRMAGS